VEICFSNCIQVVQLVNHTEQRGHFETLVLTRRVPRGRGPLRIVQQDPWFAESTSAARSFQPAIRCQDDSSLCPCLSIIPSGYSEPKPRASALALGVCDPVPGIRIVLAESGPRIFEATCLWKRKAQADDSPEDDRDLRGNRKRAVWKMDLHLRSCFIAPSTFIFSNPAPVPLFWVSQSSRSRPRTKSASSCIKDPLSRVLTSQSVRFVFHPTHSSTSHLPNSRCPSHCLDLSTPSPFTPSQTDRVSFLKLLSPLST